MINVAVSRVLWMVVVDNTASALGTGYIQQQCNLFEDNITIYAFV